MRKYLLYIKCLVLSLVFSLLFLGFSWGTVDASETVYYIHTDHLGSTSVITQNGTEVERTKYYPYGTEIGTSNQALGTSQISNIQYQISEKSYTGQISDKGETGLLYYNARYYDPSVAKFTQADLVGDGINKYAYTGNNPINLTDPTGNWRDYFGEPVKSCGEIGCSDDTGSDSVRGYETHERYLIDYLSWQEYIIKSGLDTQILDLVEMDFYPTVSVAPDVNYGPFYSGENQEIMVPDVAHLKLFIEDVVSFYKLMGIEDLLPNEKIEYTLVHELRHAWQDMSLENVKFSGKVAKRGIRLGLVFEDITSDSAKLVIRPYGAERNFDRGKNKYVNFFYYKTNDRGNEIEIDAIIAAAMINPATRDIIKNQYPQIWNLMLKQPGFFNPQYFQPVQ